MSNEGRSSNSDLVRKDGDNDLGSGIYLKQVHFTSVYGGSGYNSGWLVEGDEKSPQDLAFTIIVNWYWFCAPIRDGYYSH